MPMLQHAYFIILIFEEVTSFYTLCILACILTQKGLWKFSITLFLSGRSERIRTFDPLLPKQVRYQAAPRSEKKPRRGLCWRGNLWGERWDLNPRPPGPQPGALPTELLPPRESSYRQDLFFWQAFFSINVIWILSRKKTTLRHAAERGSLRVHFGLRMASQTGPHLPAHARSHLPDGAQHHTTL